MSVQNETSSVSYELVTGTEVLPVSFYFLQNNHIKVTMLRGANVTELLLDSDYTVSGAGSEAGGSVTMITGIAGDTIVIFRSVPITQLLDYVYNDRFPAQSHEKGLDKLTMVAQMLGETVKRAIRFPEIESGKDGTIARSELRKNRLLGFNGSGDVDLTTDLSQVKALISSTASTLLLGQDGLAFENIAAMQGFGGSTEAVDLVKDYPVHVQGYTTKNDGGGGVFYLREGSFTANGGTIFAATGIGAGWYFERETKPSVNVKDFGAKGDGVANDKAAFDRIVSFAGDARLTVIVPAGSYNIATAWTLPENVKLAFEPGAKLTGEGNLTINGRIEADITQHIFDTSGDVTLSSGSTDLASIMWFGCVADSSGIGSGTDNRAMMQNAFDSCLTGPKICVPPTKSGSNMYRVSGTVNIGSSGVFRSVQVTGFNMGGVANSSGARIFGDHTEGPTFNLRLLRQSKIEGISFFGRNGSTAQAAANNASRIFDDYVLTGLWADPSDVKKVYTGLAFDQEGIGSGSATTWIEDVKVEGYVVGFSTSMGGGPQGDTLTFGRRSTARFCAIGFSIGHSQNRCVTIEDVEVQRCHTIFDSLRFQGDSSNNGSLFNVSNLQGFNCAQIYNVFVSNSGPSAHSGMYVESTGRIGVIGGVSVTINSPINFSGCDFKLTPAEYGWVYFLVNSATIHFSGCSIDPGGRHIAGDPLMIYHAAASAKTLFSACYFRRQLRIFCNNEHNVEFVNCEAEAYDIISSRGGVELGGIIRVVISQWTRTIIQSTAGSLRSRTQVKANIIRPFPQWPIDNTISNMDFGPDATGEHTTGTVSFVQPSVGNNVQITVGDTSWMSVEQYLRITGSGHYEVVSVDSATEVTVKNLGFLGSASNGATVGVNYRVRPAGPVTFDTTLPGRFLIGDLLCIIHGIDNGVTPVPSTESPCLRVVGINGDTITCVALFDFLNRTPRTLVNFWQRQFVTTVACRGDFTNGSSAVANVTNVTLLAVGDWVYSVALPTSPVNGPTPRRIIGISGTTVTLSANANRTCTGALFSNARLQLDNSPPYKSGSEAPVVSADFLGEEYLDTVGNNFYKAIALGSTTPADDWKLMT